MLDKRVLCEEIGNFFGIFYEDLSHLLVIDDGIMDHTYSSEDELLEDWLPRLKESDKAGEYDWSEIIEYIESEIL
jgi:hypothetical protein